MFDIVCIIGDALILTTNSRTYVTAVPYLNTKVVDIHISPREYIDTACIYTVIKTDAFLYQLRRGFSPFRV